MKNLLDFWRPSSLIGSMENPFRELNRLQRQIDRLFDGYATSPRSARWMSETPAFTPSCDIEESENHYLMSFDLPGVKKEDVKVDLQDNVLTVSGERKEEREENAKGQYRSERYHGLFSRSFTLPAGAKPEQIEAEYKDGVLRLAVPKAAVSKGQQIKIGEGKPGFFDRFLGHKKEEAKTQEKRSPERVA